MGTFGVVDPVELIDLRLPFLQRRRDRLLVEEPKQGLMETFVLALRGRRVGLPGDRRHAEPGDVVDEVPNDPAT